VATAPALYKKLSYKPEDLEFLGLVNEAPSTLIGKPGLPVNDFAELRKHAADRSEEGEGLRRDECTAHDAAGAGLGAHAGRRSTPPCVPRSRTPSSSSDNKPWASRW
jgi:tripartite-type tricarboxylate transporter receptor subunit TctC